MRWPWDRRTEDRRTPRQDTGVAGERAAERFLRKSGYRILARNVSYRQGEVDLVALEKSSGTLCFVEVRSRTLKDKGEPAITPEETVTLAKRRRIVRAARAFLRERGVSAERSLRFDVIAVEFDGQERRRPAIRHLPGAFDAAGRAI